MINKKSFIAAFAIAFLHFFVTTVFQFDKLFFEYSSDFMHYGEKNTYSIFYYYLGIKILFFVFLSLAYSFLFWVYDEYKRENKSIQRGVYIFFFYLFIAFLHILILFPGTWAWDDIGTVNTIKHYGIDAWQHIFSSLLQTIFLQFIPCAGGIIIIQNIIISILVAYSVTILEKTFLGGQIIKNRLIDTFIKCLPFLFPGVLTYQFSGYRMGLYVYIELALISMQIVSFKSKKEWKVGDIIFYGTLSVLVAQWRTEAMFFMPISCILLLMQKNCCKPLKIFGTLFIVLGFLTTDFMQKTVLKMMNKNQNYNVISTMTPAVELIRNATEKDSAYISEMEKVLNINAVYEYPTQSGTALYWNEDAHAVKETYTKADYKAYIKAFFAMSLKHPDIVIKERFSMFWKTSAFGGKTNITNINSETNSHTAFNYMHSDAEMVQKFAAYPHNQPIFPALRNALLTLWTNGATYRIIFNPVIPMCFLCAAFLFCAVKKKWYYLVLLSALLIRTVLAFLTAPSPWFMYYLGEYLLGWTLAIYYIIPKIHITR